VKKRTNKNMQNEEQKTENTLEKLYEQLPQNVQDAISSVSVAEKLQDIAKRNGLHIDEAGIVSDEATMVMLGIENPKDFVASLENKLKYPKEKITTIVKDIDKEIFDPIRDSLQKMYEEEDVLPGEYELSADSRIINEIHGGGEKTKQLNDKVALPTEKNMLINDPATQNSQKIDGEKLMEKLTDEDLIFQNKMSGIVSLPREERTIENKTPIEEKKIRHIDPYREPTE